MRLPAISVLFSAVGILVTGFAAQAQESDTRIASMPYAECLSIIGEVSQELDENPVHLADANGTVIARIEAEDGFVTVSCNRDDNKMILTKSPVPEAAGMTAAR